MSSISPKVSVIIPAYNAMRFLPETLKTVMEQTFTDFEVVIVNDGSTDHTAEWVSQFPDPRVKLISQPNQGLSGARNTGIQHSNGEYIAILDADDLWEPTKLEKQVQCLEAKPDAGLVYTWTALADEEGRLTGRVVTSHAEGYVWKQLIEFNMVCCGSTPVIRRRCFETEGGFATDLPASEDWDMWLRIARKYPFAVVKEPLIRYRQYRGTKSKDCHLMIETSRVLIERAFSLAPTELLHLRNRSYGSINLYLAWKALENKDYEQATYFRRQACAHRPQLHYAPRCIRLRIAAALLRWLGPEAYTKVFEALYALRRIRAVVAS